MKKDTHVRLVTELSMGCPSWAQAWQQVVPWKPSGTYAGLGVRDPAVTGQHRAHGDCLPACFHSSSAPASVWMPRNFKTLFFNRQAPLEQEQSEGTAEQTGGKRFPP